MASSRLYHPYHHRQPLLLLQASSSPQDTVAVDYAVPERYLSDHPSNNVPPHIAALVGRGLHEKENHPLGILTAKIAVFPTGAPSQLLTLVLPL